MDSLSPDNVKMLSQTISSISIFGIILTIIIFSIKKKINAYEEFIDGAKEGFQISIKIIPYLVGMLVALALFRSSGAMEILLSILDYIFRKLAYALNFFNIINYNGESLVFIKALPVGLMKPLSGSAANSLMIETIKHEGVGSLASKMAAIIQGSSDATFYIISLYLGSVGLRKGRHLLFCGLFADLCAITASIIVCHLFF